MKHDLSLNYPELDEMRITFIYLAWSFDVMMIHCYRIGHPKARRT